MVVKVATDLSSESPENMVLCVKLSYRFDIWLAATQYHHPGQREAGMGVTKPIFSVPLFSTFSAIVKKALAIENRDYIWQVSPQLSCGDTCQIWMWCRESNRYFCKIENFAYGEISERSFSNPHPRTSHSLMISAASRLWLWNTMNY